VRGERMERGCEETRRDRMKEEMSVSQTKFSRASLLHALRVFCLSSLLFDMYTFRHRHEERKSDVRV